MIQNNNIVNRSYSFLRFVLILTFCSNFGSIDAQSDSTSYWEEHFSLNGYVKEMQTISFKGFDNMHTDHLIHNRLNLKYYASNAITVVAELRNRMFYGETVKLQQPNYGQQLAIDKGVVDLSWVLLDKQSIVLQSTIDRLHATYSTEKWDVRIGRQRINWGINLAFNPNDLFNAYNFADFDYVERPGTDAIRVQYYAGATSGFDFAVKPSEDKDEWIAVGMYKFNKYNYDFQIQTGLYLEDIVVGVGWAGNISKIGFKGESTYFHPRKDGRETGVVSSAISFDYSFDNSLYINLSILHNSAGVDSIANVGSEGFSITDRPLSAKNLMPNKFTYFAQASGPFNPALSGSMALMYLQGINVAFLSPSLSYTINEAWDINVVGQVLAIKSDKKIQSLGNSLFLRIQYSF